MRFAVSIGLIVFAALSFAWPALAKSAEDEAKVRGLIAEWYQRVGKVPADAPWSLMAPGAIDGGPGYAEIPYQPPEYNGGPGYAEIPYQPPEYRSRAAYDGPRLNNELAAKALRFAFDIDVLKLDQRFAKVLVWERGYFYASAAQITYETAVSTMFVLEKQDSGAWLILAHQASSQGIPPNKVTSPMPDLRDLYYAKCGKTCDAEADAKKAKEF